jgi:hypothetical protein
MKANGSNNLGHSRSSRIIKDASNRRGVSTTAASQLTSNCVNKEV